MRVGSPGGATKRSESGCQAAGRPAVGNGAASNLGHLCAAAVPDKRVRVGAFAAVREVKIRVRKFGKFSDEKIGVALMAAAFNPQSGPLTDPEAEGGEREAIMALFLWGHRDV